MTILTNLLHETRRTPDSGQFLERCGTTRYSMWTTVPDADERLAFVPRVTCRPSLSFPLISVSLAAIALVSLACALGWRIDRGTVPILADPVQSSGDAIQSFQTYCSIPQPDFHGFRSADAKLVIRKLERRTSSLFAQALLVEGSLIISERIVTPRTERDERLMRNLSVVDLDQVALNPLPWHSSARLTQGPICQKFSAFGFEFDVKGSSANACRKDLCHSIVVRDGSISWSYAASRGGVFVGTNWGDTLLFNTESGAWCRMSRRGATFSCAQSDPGPNVDPGRQWYSSTPFGEDALIGEYPGGKLWKFDGVELKKELGLTPPPYRGAVMTPGYETQTLAFYCGSLYIGMWPYGELWRFDGSLWSRHTQFFAYTSSPPDFPYEEQALTSGEIFNFLGQRIVSLVVHNGSLWVATSNKGPRTSVDALELDPEIRSQYGAVWQLTDPHCQA